MGMSYKIRQELLHDTKQMAAAFLEDMNHIRRVVKSQEPQPAEVRLLSNVLRRLIVNREVQDVAAPRLGKIHIMAPNNEQHLAVKAGRSMVLYQTGGPVLSPQIQNFKIQFRKANAKTGTLEIDLPWGNLPWYSGGTRPTRVDGFLAQRVICFRDQWATRKDTIKFAAICASGVHSETPEAHIDKVLSRARYGLRFTRKGAQPAVELDMDAIGNPLTPLSDLTPLPFSYDPDRLDLVMVELLAAAYYLSISDDIPKLETIIRAELGCA